MGVAFDYGSELSYRIKTILKPDIGRRERLVNATVDKWTGSFREGASSRAEECKK